MKRQPSQQSRTVSGFCGGASYSAPSDEAHRHPTERWEWNRPETPQERWLRLRPYAVYEPSLQHSGNHPLLRGCSQSQKELWSYSQNPSSNRAMTLSGHQPPGPRDHLRAWSASRPR
ncbi:hypothetical protein DPEC_G00017920 [Dallia pectoralis]|uniref:Uncharacterized protein n=1 Tax=Dallia pectoralis TaxID=75939 RepID=A0ACC2HFL9_DALPE|nr:hypothetical protein DPEC_G00017920 [Dallia pectoralis]